MRIIPLTTGEYYHVYSRGVDKRSIFTARPHYIRFLASMRNILLTGSATEKAKRNQSLALKKSTNATVSVLCYCLMPNHYHLLLQQITENGISIFMHKLNTSYTMYFNMNHRRKGRLFESTFHARHIESDMLLLHVSRYIHLNPLLAHLVKVLEDYKWSSYNAYIAQDVDTLCNKQQILSYWKNESVTQYRSFVQDQIEYARLLKESENGSEPFFIDC